MPLKQKSEKGKSWGMKVEQIFIRTKSKYEYVKYRIDRNVLKVNTILCHAKKN